MTIDPRIGFYLSIVAAIVSALAGAGTQWGHVVSDEHKDAILASLAILNAVINAVNAVLHAIPSQTTVDDPKKFPLGPS